MSPTRPATPRPSGRCRASSQQEDVAFSKTVADYEKASGNKIDLSIMPFEALSQKAISAIPAASFPTSCSIDARRRSLPQNAWNDKLVDVSDVVETTSRKFSETALLNSSFYNGITKKRSFYCVPSSRRASPFHIWRHLVNKAGFNLGTSRRPGTRFATSSSRCRRNCARRVHTQDLWHGPADHHRGPNDGNDLFNYFMVAYGGQDIVTKDGKLHTDDPQVREAAIRRSTS